MFVVVVARTEGLAYGVRHRDAAFESGDGVTALHTGPRVARMLCPLTRGGISPELTAES